MKFKFQRGPYDGQVKDLDQEATPTLALEDYGQLDRRLNDPLRTHVYVLASVVRNIATYRFKETVDGKYQKT